jgi:hypothetical protein
VPPSTLAPSSKPPSARYLSLTEREEIALCRVQGHGVRAIALRLGRSASTRSRELRRNTATLSGGPDYRATTAQWQAERAARRPKPAKLAVNAALRRYVHDRLLASPVYGSMVWLIGEVPPSIGIRGDWRQSNVRSDAGTKR